MEASVCFFVLVACVEMLEEGHARAAYRAWSSRHERAAAAIAIAIAAVAAVAFAIAIATAGTRHGAAYHNTVAKLRRNLLRPHRRDTRNMMWVRRAGSYLWPLRVRRLVRL